MAAGPLLAAAPSPPPTSSFSPPTTTKVSPFLRRPTTTSLSATVTSTSTSAITTSSRKPHRFREQDAFPESLPLHAKNPHFIYKELKRLARQGKLKQALVILDYLEQRGVPVSVTAFSALLAACARSKALAEGRQVHVHIRINGLDRNEFLLTKLVQMYASCGAAEDARRVFEGMDGPPVSVFPWNALLRGNVVGGGRWDHGALEVFEEMRLAGVEMNEYSFSCLIKSLAGSPSAIQGMKAHALLIKKGFIGSSVLLQTSLIDMYFKCGKVRQALNLFDEILDRDIVAWGAVIAGFAHNGLRREALEYLRWIGSERIEPNSVILITVLPVIGELSERRLGQEIHAFALKHFKGYSKQQFILSALIDMYCKCGDIVSARHVFYGSGPRNRVLWTALMSGYSSSGRLDQALRSIIWMQQEGIKPDVVAVATALPVCAKLKAQKTGKEIHAYALKHWFLPNISLTTSLMTMYSGCGNLAYSLKMFEGMERKNVVAWTAMIDSFLKNNHVSEALEIFRLMQLSKHRPDSVAMARGLRASGQLEALKLGKEIHGQVMRRKLEWVPFVSAEIINMYGACREITLARRVFNHVASKGSLTWTSIIDAYGFNGLYYDAVGLFKEMCSDGFVPNQFTFDVILSICRNAGFSDEALKVYDSMVGKYDLKASKEHYNCIIELLNRSGRHEEAHRFTQLLSSLPS